MLIFHCTACDECIGAAEDETPALILNKVEGHTAKCHGARYVCEALTEDARKRAETLQRFWINRPVAEKVRWSAAD